MKNQNNFPIAALLKNAKKNVLGLSLLIGITGASAQNTFPAIGNVGVGTLSPSYPLHVSHGTGPTINFQIDGTNSVWTGQYIRNNSATGTTYSAFTTNNGTYTAWTYLNSAGTFGLNNAGDRIVVTRAGKVGINNSAPIYSLDVTGRVRFGNDPGGGGSGAWFRNIANTGEAGFVGMENDNHVGFWGNNGAGWAFKVNTTNGNVGIGTTSTATGYKLSVNGAIRAKELVVETGWADFVFDKNYKLRSLNEVESYINANKHLPDVPSAADVEANGVKVGEMESKLLQKVEELTLYVIELNKKVSALEKENQELKK